MVAVSRGVRRYQQRPRSLGRPAGRSVSGVDRPHVSPLKLKKRVVAVGGWGVVRTLRCLVSPVHIHHIARLQGNQFAR